MSKVLVTYNDKTFWVSPKQKETLERLENLHKGGVGAITGYRPTTDWVTPPTVNIQMITRFGVSKLYERKLDALKGISFNDVKANAMKDPVLSQLPEAKLFALFTERMSKEIESMSKTLSGDRSDAYRQGHDRCYAGVCDGVKVHFDTVKVNGQMEPVLLDGYPQTESIQLAYLELNREYVTKGERKEVNSGESVRMKNCIEAQLNQRSVGYRTLSLKEDNFDTLSVGRIKVKPTDVKGFSMLTESFKTWLDEILNS